MGIQISESAIHILLFLFGFAKEIEGNGHDRIPFSNDVLQFLDFTNTCTKHIYIEEDVNDVVEAEFKEYFDKLLRLPESSPSIITSVSFIVEMSQDDFYALQMISNVPKRAECFVPIYFVSRIDTFPDFLLLNQLETYNLYESHNFMIYVTSGGFSKVDRQGIFRRSHFPYMDTTVVEIYNKSQLNMICMHCTKAYAVPIRNLEPSLRNLNKFWDGVYGNQQV